MIVIEIANDADDKKLNLFSKRDFIGGKENYFTEIVFYLDTNLKFSPKCELSYFCFFSDLYTRILLEQANKIYGRWFLNSAHRNIVLEYHSFSLFPHKHRRRFKIILWKSKFLKIVIKLIWLNCCVFRPANGCSARRSLVEINFLAHILLQYFKSSNV